MFGIVAERGSELVGFAHGLLHLSTWSVEPTCYLEDHWNDVATAFGWDVAGGNKPTVGGTGRPSVPDGINKLLLKEGEWRLGKAQWGYLSSVGHVTWYGLAQSVQEPPREDSPLLRPRAGFGTRAGSVYAQAVCVMGALRNAATARSPLWAG
jgi:hypothetical protein